MERQVNGMTLNTCHNSKAILWSYLQVCSFASMTFRNSLILVLFKQWYTNELQFSMSNCHMYTVLSNIVTGETYSFMKAVPYDLEHMNILVL